jgi:cell division protein FtsA
MDEKVMVGLDIGSSKVCAIVGRLNDAKKLEIMGVGYVEAKGVEKGLVRNINKTTEAIIAALDEASKVSEVLIGSVISNISSQHIVCQQLIGNITLENGDREIQYKDTQKLTNNMKVSRVHAGNTIIHVCPQEYCVDGDHLGEVYNPIGMPGVRLEANFLTITSPSNALENLDKSIKDAPGKVEITEKVLSVLAASISSLTTEEKEAGVALIDIGAGTTDIVIYHKNIVRYACTLPFGGNNITSDIQQGCNVLPDQAEQLKVKFAAALQINIPEYEVISVPGIGNRSPKDVSVKNIALITEERLKEIGVLIYSKIAKSGYANKLSGGIVLTGGTSQLPDIEVLFAKITGKDVRIGHPNIDLAKSDFTEVNNPAYATAIGLLWKGFKSYDARKDSPENIKLTSKQKVTSNSTINFEEPIPKNFWRKSVDMVKGILKDDVGKSEDNY